MWHVAHTLGASVYHQWRVVVAGIASTLDDLFRPINAAYIGSSVDREHDVIAHVLLSLLV